MSFDFWGVDDDDVWSLRALQKGRQGERTSWVTSPIGLRRESDMLVWVCRDEGREGREGKG